MCIKGLQFTIIKNQLYLHCNREDRISWFHTHTHTLRGYFQNNRDFSNWFLFLSSFQSTKYKIEVRKIMGPLGASVSSGILGGCIFCSLPSPTVWAHCVYWTSSQLCFQPLESSPPRSAPTCLACVLLTRTPRSRAYLGFARSIPRLIVRPSILVIPLRVPFKEHRFRVRHCSDGNVTAGSGRMLKDWRWELVITGTE